MRVAIFSDVHANLPALEAVLGDIRTAEVDGRFALGDIAGYAPWTNEVVKRLQGEAFPVVMGLRCRSALTDVTHGTQICQAAMTHCRMR